MGRYKQKPLSGGYLLSGSHSSKTYDARLAIFVVSILFATVFGVAAFFRLASINTSGTIAQLVGIFAHVRQGTDSWEPMLKSLDYFHAHPEMLIYQAKLYDTLIYSLVSLLPLAALEKLGITGNHMLRLLAWASWLAVWLVGGISALLASRLLALKKAKLSILSILSIFIACIFFYPLLKGYTLGNAQTFLTLGFALLIYLWTFGKEKSSGIVVAALAMVKPQYVLILLWMAARKRWGAFWSGMIFAAVMFSISILVFGWRNNLDYLPVLASLSHKAQSHYANQSMFGTLNRMVFNGENLDYHPYVYTSYIPWIYYTTVATSLLLVGLALFYPWGRFRGSTADIATMGIASVAASPMAWEHHYGIVFPIFVWLWFQYGCWEQRRTWLLGLSFFLCSSWLSVTMFLASKPVLNLLQSYIYFGALLLMFLLYRLPRAEERGEPHLI
ncbi:MAG: glycosyltransferase family 87 protein [Edaphobacter sp.]